MYPMYPLLSLKIPSFGLRSSRVRFQGSWNSVTWGPGPTHLPPTRLVAGSGVTPESPWKVIKFHASLEGNKSHENWSQGHSKSWKIDPGIMRNPIAAKVDFCNTSLVKCLAVQSQTQIQTQKSSEKESGNRYEQIMFFGPNVPTNLCNGSPKSNRNR